VSEAAESLDIKARRARARRGEGERLKQEILSATEQLLAETDDFSKISMRMIAERVGVSPPAIYMHFADKDELLFELCEDRFGEFRKVMQEARSSTDDPVGAVRACGRAYVQFALDHPEHYGVLFLSKTEFPTDVTVEELNGYRAFLDLVAAVQRAVDEGRYRDVDPTIAAIGLWTSMHGLVSLLIRAPNFPWPELDVLVDHVLDVQTRGLAVDPKDSQSAG
jgi:AcrR family transcriptional regulator